MTNWLTGRNAIKRAGLIWGADKNAQVDRIIEACSKRIERETRCYFIPRTETRYYRWPRRSPGNSSYILRLDQEILSVTTLQTKAQDSSPTTIAAADYFLEPVNDPPYDSIEIDLSSSAALESGNTPQRSIGVAGVWGHSQDTKPAGTVASGLASSASATSMVVSDASKVDVGDTLVIETERVFVTEQTFAALSGISTTGALTASVANVTVPVTASHGIKAGEVIQAGSESMYVQSVSGNNLTVIRAYDGSVLAAHDSATALYINRTYTIERGVNGTTAATHADTTAMTAYAPPADVVQLAIAETLAALAQEGAAWGRSIGTGEGAGELSGRSLADLRKRVTDSYKRVLMGAV